jgi:hypothetical protein
MTGTALVGGAPGGIDGPIVARLRAPEPGVSGFDLAAASPAERAPDESGWTEFDVRDRNPTRAVVDPTEGRSGGVEILADWGCGFERGLS